jgi:uncharacterized protein (TIGR03067 family)
MKPILAIIVFAVASCAIAAEPEDAKTMQGSWTPVKAELAGKPMPDDLLKAIKLKLDGDKYEVTVGATQDKGTYTLDAGAKPKRMTIKGVEGPNRDKTLLAIYEISGDTLRVCYDLSGVKHPDEFATAEGTRLYLVTYQRSKD